MLWYKTSQWLSLQARIKAVKVPHALLVTGTPTEALSLARHFSAALLCNTPHAGTGVACGACRACQLLDAGSHSDYIEVSPADDSRVIKIQQIRSVCEALGLTAQYGGYRIALITPADVMHQGAANSLLKTLEEPRPNVIIILVSSKLGAIPITIRSRCQRIRSAIVDKTLATQAQKTLYGDYLQAWQAGLLHQRDYISIAEDWSKADHEVVFQSLFSWLTLKLKQCFIDENLPSRGIGNCIETTRQRAMKVEARQLMDFYDKILPAYQFAAKPGVSHRALYEKLFIEAQAIKFHSKEILEIA